MDFLPKLPPGFCWDQKKVGLSLHHDEFGSLRSDFVKGEFGYRIRAGGGKGQAVFRAVGDGPNGPRFVFDGTGGLCRDAFLLAWLGCKVVVCERSPIIFALVADALERAMRVAEIHEKLGNRLDLILGDANQVMDGWQGTKPEVVYLDPMHPEREKTALVKKEMRIFRSLVGADSDAERLFQKAIGFAGRVVVKRPRKGNPLAEGVSSAWKGKTTRFDLYLS